MPQLGAEWASRAVLFPPRVVPSAWLLFHNVKKFVSKASPKTENKTNKQKQSLETLTHQPRASECGFTAEGRPLGQTGEDLQGSESGQRQERGESREH